MTLICANVLIPLCVCCPGGLRRLLDVAIALEPRDALAAAAAARAGAGAALAHLAALTLALAANGVSCAFGPFRGV